MKKETNQKRRNNHMLTYMHNKERNSVTYMYYIKDRNLQKWQKNMDLKILSNFDIPDYE